MNSICEPFEGGGELWLEAFEGRMEGGGAFVARGGSAEETMFSDGMGPCVLLEGD